MAKHEERREEETHTRIGTNLSGGIGDGKKQKWTVSLQIGPGAVMDTWTSRSLMESSEYYGRTTTAYRS